MAPLKFALCLACLVLGSVAQKTDLHSSVYVHQDSGFVSADIGDTVTLRCFYKGDAVMFYWYKQLLRQQPRLISKFYKHDKTFSFYNEFENNSRFTLDTGNGKNHLIISGLQISDSASYYCVGIYAYEFDFAEGVTVNVRGSWLNIQTLVHWSELTAAPETTQPGGSKALTCMVRTDPCDGHHSIYWFKESEESPSGLVYTNRSRSDENKTRACFFNIPMKSQNLSHAGMYYCAFATCGHMLFGDRKESHLERERDSVSLVHVLSGALTFTIILVVILACAALRINATLRRQSTGSQGSSVAASTPNAEGYQDSDNLHYAALREHKVNRSTRQRDTAVNECVYSRIK